MPEYSAIINKLTQKQKLRLLADINVLDEPEYRNMGIPPLRIDDNEGEGVFDGGEQRAFSPAALAETWDVCRMQSIAQVEAWKQRGQGMTLASVPAPKSRIGLYSEGVSEEPLISMEVARAYRLACVKSSLPFVTHGLCLDAQDAAWMGAVPDRDTAEEVLLRPTRELHEGDDCAIGLMLRTDPRFPTYEEVSLSVAASLPREQAVFCRCKRPEDTVRLLQEGYVLIGGNESALSTALQRDKALRKDMERGRDVHERLEEVTADHEAISEDAIDAALKRVLEVVFRAKHCYESAEKGEDASAQTGGESFYSASVATTVMLRNQGMLPLEPTLDTGFPGNPGSPGRKLKVGRPRRIVQIGDPFPIGGDERSGAERLAVRMQENGVPLDGYAPGYDPTSPDGGGEHLAEARALAESADVILLCLGGRQHRVGRELPPNQLLLAERLRSCAAHIVAIVVGDEPFDTGFASEYAGLLRVSSYAEEAVDALADVLCGTQEPGGRLAVTLYADSEKRMEARRLDVSRYNLKTGPFFGYRAYPDSGIPIDGKIDVASSMTYTEGFSFGYGLSYAKVTYSKLQVVGERAIFTVTNRSNRVAVAVPQLYVSKPDSRVLRPREQLCGWEHLTLQPLETRVVSVPIRLPEVLEPYSGQYVVEGGTYILRLGTSSSDTLMKRCIQVSGRTLVADGKKLYEYWASESNILQDGYTLEARYKMKKRSPKHICLALILLGLAVGVRFFSFDRGENSLFVNIAAGGLLLCALVCCVFELLERNREKQRLIQEVGDLNDRFFETAETAPLTSAATMFSKETAEDVTQKIREERTVEDADDEEMHTIDKTFTLADAAADLVEHAKTCGYSLEKNDAWELLAAMSSSHLLMTQHMSNRQVAALQEILCSYFGTVADNASVGEAVSEETDLLLTHTGGDVQPSSLFLAIERARNKPDTPVIFRLTGVCPEGIPACIAPFVRFAGSPLTCNTVHAPVPGRAEQNLKLPSNFWLLIRPRPGYCKRMAAYVAEVTAVISCRVEPYMATSADDARRLTYWQFKYLFERARDEMNVREDRWKQIDRLVAAVSGLGGLSNRVVTGIEQYVATFCACGGEEEIALDRAMRSRLILPLESGFERSHTVEDVEPGGLIDSIFGEDSLPASYQLAKWIEHGELMDPGDEPEEMPVEAYGDIPTETYEDTYGDTPTETYEDTYGDTPTETYEDTYGDTPTETYEDTYGDTPMEDYPEDAFRTDAESEDEQTETQV